MIALIWSNNRCKLFLVLYSQNDFLLNGPWNGFTLTLYSERYPGEFAKSHIRGIGALYSLTLYGPFLSFFLCRGYDHTEFDFDLWARFAPSLLSWLLLSKILKNSKRVVSQTDIAGRYPLGLPLGLSPFHLSKNVRSVLQFAQKWFAGARLHLMGLQIAKFQNG